MLADEHVEPADEAVGRGGEPADEHVVMPPFPFTILPSWRAAFDSLLQRAQQASLQIQAKCPARRRCPTRNDVQFLARATFRVVEDAARAAVGRDDCLRRGEHGATDEKIDPSRATGEEPRPVEQNQNQRRSVKLHNRTGRQVFVQMTHASGTVIGTGWSSSSGGILHISATGSSSVEKSVNGTEPTGNAATEPTFLLSKKPYR